MSQLQDLRRQIAQLQEEKQQWQAEQQELHEDKTQLTQENQKLREDLVKKEAELQALFRKLFGRSSERFTDDVDQLKFAFAGSDEVDDAIEGIKQAEQENDSCEAKPGKKRRRREKLPEHLPREVVVIDLPPEEKAGLVCIGEDVTETLVFQRPQLTVIETHYPKYAKPRDPDQGIAQAARQAGLVEGNRYDTSIAAEVVTAKYGYHLPIYRQEDLFAGSGWNPSRSTLLNLLVSVATLIRPLVEFFASEVRSDVCLGSDDTGVCLLLPENIPKFDPDDPKSGRVGEVIGRAKAKGEKSIKAKMWAYRGISVPLNVFDFTISRHRDGPDLFLINNDYEGTLLGDCYGANTGIRMRSCGLIVHAACVSHARRKVEAALDNHPEHAKHLMACFRELYDIEDSGRSLDAAGLLELRQQRSKQVWQHIGAYLENEMARVSTKEKIGEAKSYLLNQWTALTRYLDDPAIPIDNNETEQLMKQVALGRKNWLFIGSVAAGYRAADLMTLVSSAIRNDLDVWAYVKDVLDELLRGSTDYASLRPDVWAQSHPEHVREYRKAERRERTARRDRARLGRRISQQQA